MTDTPERSAVTRRRGVLLVTGRILLILTGGVILAVAGLQIVIHQSKPRYDGICRVEGLTSEVAVERDRLGVPRIRAGNRLDAARALGFVHAQERFFQMDLARRTSAGEQAEILGAEAIDRDRARRWHQMRARAVQTLANFTGAERQLLQAYTDGVNAGLAALSTRPVEYHLLHAEPAPWRPEDSLLVEYSLFFGLQDSSGALDLARGRLRQRLNPAVYTYLFENGSQWTSTMDGSREPIYSVPTGDVWGAARPGLAAGEVAVSEARSPGSNGWAVSGRFTKTGRALLANDLHLPLVAPNTWYHAELSFCDDEGRRRSIAGVTLPGLPVVLIGSNGTVAWGVTNASIDVTDVIVVEPESGSSSRYRTPDGPREFEVDSESIAVCGRRPVELKVRKTIWGPVLDGVEFDGHPVVVKWAAHEVDAANLRLIGLETATDVAAAMQVAALIRLPAVNLLLADAKGDIAWTFIGYLPNRKGYDGTVPVSFADGSKSWLGALPPKAVPAIKNPPGGRVWNANNLSVRANAQIGNGGFQNGARARVIQAALAQATSFREQDFVQLQHNDDAQFYQRWARLLTSTLRENRAVTDGRKTELIRQIARWDGRASAESAAYGFVRDFRDGVRMGITSRLLQANGVTPGAGAELFETEEPIWMLAEQQPAAVEAALGESWGELMADAVQRMWRTSDGIYGARMALAQRTWGQRNLLAAAHPLSATWPALGRWLDFAHVPLAGDNHMPLVQGPTFGPNVRMVVSPGAEPSGLFQMPGGQSGNPFSIHYDDQLEAWRQPKGMPLLAGETEHRLRLLPKSGG